MEAIDLAVSLTKVFLENGNFDLAGGAIKGRLLDVAPAAAVLVDDYYHEEQGFAGLSVQSVGCTVGTEDKEVIVYVTKGSRKALREIPDNIEDITVRAEVIGRPRINVGARIPGHSYFYERGGRIACGSSIAPSTVGYAGTLGAFAKNDQDHIFAISNNHVFAHCNHTPIGMPILSPATRDANAGRRAPTEVCVYSGMIELRSGVPQLVTPVSFDAAYGRVRDANVISSWQGDDVDGFDTPPNVIEPETGMRVKKFGRTTGFTLGTIEALQPAAWMMPYRSDKFNADVWLQDTWTIRWDGIEPFALGGDSGSLVVTEDGGSALGLVFAANALGSYAEMCPLGPILESFGNLELLHGYEI